MTKSNTRTYNTLFMLESLDGKISTGDVDERDVDSDFPQIAGVKEGLHQYYELEKRTDFVSFISGKVLAKIGFNSKPLEEAQRIPVNFVVVDNKPHLNEHGLEFLTRKFKKLFIVTTNRNHPAYKMQEKLKNIIILHYDDSIDFPNLFHKLCKDYAIKRVTIQSGGTLNAALIRDGLIDAVRIVIAPCLIGGQATPTLVDGKSLRTANDLTKIRPLKLKDCKALEDSYVVLSYEVIN